MSVLTLVRHAQASFFADHYDELSTLGQTQASILGKSWVQSGRTVDEVYVGPRKRQQQTAAVVVECYRQSGMCIPDPILLPELDEYDLGGILRQLAPDLARQNGKFAGVMDNHRSGTTNDERARNFQKMFEPLMFHWLTVHDVVEGIENWPTFRQRVQRGLEHMLHRPGRRRNIVAFTSGGFIGAAVQWVLGAPERTALEMNWRIRNAALTEFVFSGSRITLDSFNSVAHFTTTDLLTYR